MKKSHNLRSL